MRQRFHAEVLAVILATGTVVGLALFGYCVAWSEEATADMVGTAAYSASQQFLAPVFTVLVLGAAAGALGWITLFLLRRDGSHRLEWVALLPKNYGGRSPFDVSARHKSE